MFDNIMEQQILPSNLFAFFMTRSFEEKFGMMSEMTMGYIDNYKFTGELKWHPVEFKYMYAMNLDDIKVNGKSLFKDGCKKDGKKCLITIDSGTSHLAMPSWAY
jgi:hypothetical protein